MAVLIVSYASSAQTDKKAATKVADKEQNNVANPNQDATMTSQEQQSKTVISGNAKKPETAAKTQSTQSTDGTTRPDGTGTGTPIKSEAKTATPATKTNPSKK